MAAIAEKEKRDEVARDDRKEKKRQDSDYVFHKQWDLEKEEKRTIERLAEVHKKEAEKDLNDWADKSEGRKGGLPPVDNKEIDTYFDKQLVEGIRELETTREDDSVVPLPGTYNRKTARTAAVEASVSAAPRSEFDQRLEEEKRLREKAEREAKAKEEEEEKFRAARAEKAAEEDRRKEAQAAAQAAEAKKCEDARRAAEEEELRVANAKAEAFEAEEAERERREAAGDAHAGEEAQEQAEGEVSKARERRPLSAEEAAAKAAEEEKRAKAAKAKEDEERILGRRSGASINRFESEAIAERHRVLGEAYFKAGYLAEARKAEEEARKAAPWVEERREYETPEENAARKAREEEEEAARRAKDEACGIPAPRGAGRVELNFSKGRKSMPARERIETDEEVALREAEDLRRKKAENPDAHGPAEEQAQWLKQRGDHFYRQRDFRAAVNAYSSALELNKRDALSFSNRAVCNLRLKAFAAAIADCTSAFDLLRRVKTVGMDKEKIEQETMKKARCLLRRGMAHTRLGMLDAAIKDLDAAGKLLPDREVLKDDLEGLRQAVAAHPYFQHKEQGDAAFKAGDHDAALAAYDAALAADPGCFQALSNRAACWLAKENYEKTIDDCSAALRIVDPAGQAATKLALRLLVRRGTAYCWQGSFDKGRADFKAALLLDKGNKTLQEDVEMLVTTTGAARSLSQFMGENLSDARNHALAALGAAGVQRPGEM